MSAASLHPTIRAWRRIISALLILCVSISSAESLWGDVPEDRAVAGPETTTGNDAAPVPGESPGEDCPCLCDCACVNAQRVVHPEAVLAPTFDLSILPRPFRGDLHAPGSVVLEPHLRPPRA